MKLDGARLFPFPFWADNPYLNLLYLAARAEGLQVLGSTLLDSLESRLKTAGPRDVLHVHWTAPICQVAKSGSEARERLDRFRSAVNVAKSAGMTVIWTVHNAIPHDAKFLETELELNRFLTEIADLIHIMTEETPKVVSEYYSLPKVKQVHIPHSSYRGVYGSSHTKASAREHFDIKPDEKTILFFGQMRPYKGLITLLKAAELANRGDSPIVLLLAGKTDLENREILEENLPRSVRVIRDHSFISDDDVDVWFSAADVAVFPYTKILNSGSVHLASTFGVPCVLPNEAHLLTQFKDDIWVTFFDRANEVESLAHLLREWVDVDNRRGKAAIDASKHFTPYMMSLAFARALTRVLSE